jgi:hypothetical protein
MAITVGSPTGFAPTDIGEAFLPDVTAMSDESIIMLLTTRLRDVDSQIGSITQTLQQQTARAQSLGQEAQRLNALRGLLGNEPYMDPTSGNLRGDYALSQEEIASIAETIGVSPESVGLDADGNGAVNLSDVMLHITIGGRSLHGVSNREGFQLRADSLGEQIRDCNSGNEQLMIKLQSAMQQRTQIVQMATNMLKAGDEARDAVVGNLR